MTKRPEPGFLSSLTGEADDQSLVDQCCAVLGLEPPSEVERLSTGHSGSLVFSVAINSMRAVIKFTTDPERLGRAQLEAGLLGGAAGLSSHVMPTLIASESGYGWVGIATERGEPLLPPQLLRLDAWVSVARDLATLHQRPTNTVMKLTPRPQVSAGNNDSQVKPWSDLGAGKEAAIGAALLNERPKSNLPLVLVHGDCHTENIVETPPGRYLWIDWQEAYLGDGVSDLVFLWQRAEFAGAAPPRDEMTATYARTRELSPAEFQPLLDGAELHSLLQDWPPFLSYGGASAQNTMRTRLLALTRC